LATSDLVLRSAFALNHDTNAHNFSRTFGVTLWYGIGILVAVFLGLFALPRRVKPPDLAAEMARAAGEPSALQRSGP